MEDEDVHIGSQEFDKSALMFALDRIKLVDNPVCVCACVLTSGSIKRPFTRFTFCPVH